MTTRPLFVWAACATVLTLLAAATPATAQSAASKDAYVIAQVMPRGGMDLALYRKSQAVLVRTPRVLIDTLKKPEIAGLDVVKKQSDPASWLAEQLVVDFPGDTDLMRISLKGDDKKAAATIVNAVADSWMRMVVESERTEAAQRRNQLEDMRMSLRERIKALSEASYNLEASVGTGQIAAARRDGQLAVLRDQEVDMQRQLLRAELKIARETVRLELAPVAAPDKRVVEIELKMAEAERNLLTNRLDAIHRNIEACYQRIVHSADLEAQRTDLELLKANAQRIAAELETATINSNAPSSVRMIERAPEE